MNKLELDSPKKCNWQEAVEIDWDVANRCEDEWKHQSAEQFNANLHFMKFNSIYDISICVSKYKKLLLFLNQIFAVYCFCTIY